MQIAPTVLSTEYQNALKQWPFIATVEQTYKLPRMLLFAVGSRETNLRDVVGDGGHGNGVFQLDDRSHTIPKPFPVTQQADKAGAMLRSLIDHFNGNIRAALAAYNAGAGTVEYNLANRLDIDTGTANGNYSADTYARMVWLQNNYPEVLDMDETTLRQIIHDEVTKVVQNTPVHVGGIQDYTHKAFPSLEGFLTGIPGYKTWASRSGK